MDNKEIIVNAYEESRYHRQFHHTLFGIFFALYLALLGFQLTNVATVLAVSDDVWLKCPVAIMLYIALPVWLFYIFKRYHNTIAHLNSLIANLAGDGAQGATKASYDILTFQKYKDAVGPGKWPMLTGSGHWFFLISLWVVAFFNLYVSWVIVTKCK